MHLGRPMTDDVLQAAVPRRNHLLRRALVGGAGTLAVAALVWGVAVRDRPAMSLIVVPMPVAIAVPTPVPPPAPPAPPPEPAPVAKPAPQVRAASPAIDVQCLIGNHEDDHACAWDDGFPAISLDGKTVVSTFDPVMGSPRGGSGFGLELIDVATSRVLRSTILTLGWSDEADDPAEVAKHYAELQRWFTPAKYRTLAVLPISNEPGETGLRAEVENDSIRVIDNQTSTALWRYRFEIPKPTIDPESDAVHCHVSSARAGGAYWDAKTRTVIATALFVESPCSCTNEEVFQAHHLAD
jgi:hypothetical protein